MTAPTRAAPERAADLSLSGIVKMFGHVAALAGVDLTVAPGELLTILGPSGSGKTTLLKVVAGFELPDEGVVRLGGLDVTETPPSRRDIGMVFQNYALFPHMTVAANVAFPLVMRRRPGDEIARRVADALAMVELAGYEERLPRQLSGGQQQRVALARAIVFDPRILLLDEPFGALDRKLREAMQLEVKRLQRRLGLTTIFITHDQEEALVLSDRIAVMSAGRIEQLGPPEAVYRRPANRFVADFIGESNLWPGRIEAAAGDGATVVLDEGGTVHAASARAWRPGEPVACLVRPEAIVVVPEGVAPGDAAGTNRFAGTVVETVFLGMAHKYRIAAERGPEILARMAAQGSQAARESGGAIAVAFAPEDVHLVPLG